MPLSFKKWFQDCFSIDSRSLELFRVALGIFGLFDLAGRAIGLEAFYTDFGLMPRIALLNHFNNVWSFSLHLLSGQLLFQIFLFSFHALCLLSFIFGYRPKLSLFAVWLLTVSVQNRNPLVFQNEDIVYRVMLFWSLFLPELSTQKNCIPASWKTIPLLMQIPFIYVFSVVMKSGDAWTKDFTAVWIALNYDPFATSFAVWLREYKTVVKILTFAVRQFELYGPLILFSPLFFVPLRMISILGFVLLHIGIGSSLTLGGFPWLMSLCMIVYLPRQFWEKWEGISAVGKFNLNQWVHSVSQRLGIPTLHTAYATREPLASGSVSFNPLVQSDFQLIKKGFKKGALLFFGLLCFSYCVLINLANIPVAKVQPLIKHFEFLGTGLSLTQHWGMFAPTPARDDSWPVFEGKLVDGSPVDLFHFTESAPSYEKPKLLSNEFPRERWRMFYTKLGAGYLSAYRVYFAGYLCRSWNREHFGGRALKELKLHYFTEALTPEGKTPPKKVTVWEGHCGK